MTKKPQRSKAAPLVPRRTPASRGPVATRPCPGWTLAWGIVLVGLVTWPFFLPGEFLWRDMAVLHHMGFTPANFGGGDLPARNAPQDGLLALFSMFLPATWLARAIVISAASAAAWAGWRLSATSPAPAMALAVANPFVIERLLQGQWTLAVAAWLLPVIAAAGERTWLGWMALFGASLTPTGALLGLATALVALPGSARRRLATLGYGAVLSVPWLVPGLLSDAAPTDASAGVAAFAPRAEAAVGTLGSLLTLGGLWNAEALPPSRAAGFALFGLVAVALVATRVRRVPRGLLVLAGLGIGGAVLAWLYAPALGQAIAAVPGLGILRDSQKLVALAIPAYVAALGALPGLREPGRLWTLAALASLFLQMPDASTALGVLRPGDADVNVRLVAQLDGRATFFADRGNLVYIPDGVAVDPYSKAAVKVESGELAVDGATIDFSSARWQAAEDAWSRRDMDTLEQLGIGAVVEGGAVVAETNAPVPAVPWALTLVWLLAPVGAVPLSFLLSPQQSPQRSRQ
ncbi:hypothetical protein [uncultured Corynebacterium sp.]|uniref:hypothetical protein n=1 Tax=uncultured Corynebacterium sp. TaxID=159447 RepID=UPI0025DFD932|nr:hypothetical protein [uncultured Corynebacterium sp.]